MKKLLTGILATATCFTCLAFAACGGDKDKSNLTAAADFITDLYKDQNEKVRADYDVASKVVIDGVTYTITWSVDVADGVKIVAGESKTTIDLNELLKEDLNYVLTATIKAPNGETTTVTFNRVVEAAPMMVPAPIQTTPTDGTEYMLYMYHVTKKQDFYFTGKMSGYYFGSTNDYAEAVTVKAVREGETYFHLTFEDENNVTQYIGVKNAFSNGSWHNNIVFQADTELGDAAGNFLWRFNPDYKVMTTEVKDVKSGNDENTTEKEDKTFYMGTYSTHSTFSVSEISKISNSDSCLARLVTMMDRSEVDEDTKIAQTLLEVSPALTYVGEDTVTLATQGITYPDVTIAWEVKEGGSATIADGVMTLANPAAETEVTLSVTLACGDIDETVEVTFTHKPAVADIPAAGSTLTIAEAIELGNKFEKNAYTEGKYYVVGEIVSVDNDKYGNLTIKDSEGTTFTVYGSYDETGDVSYENMETKPVAGDTIKVYGIIGKYNDPQMKNAWIVEHTPGEGPQIQVPAADSLLTIAEAIELGNKFAKNAYTEGKYYVVGEIVSVDNATYGNLTIKDSDGNEFTVYGSYDSTGNVSYKDMETKPVAGDTVKVYGVIGKYNAPQMKNAWIVEHTPGVPAELPAGQEKVTVTMSELAEKNEWVACAGTTVNTHIKGEENAVSLNDAISFYITSVSNSGKYYSNGIRIYATDKSGDVTTPGSITITAKEGYEIVSVKLSGNTGSSAAYMYLGTGATETPTNAINEVVEVNATSATFTAWKNGSNGKNVAISAIEVIYKATTPAA